MSERRRNILIGPGRVFRAPANEALPDETSVPYRGVQQSPPGDGWGGNWEDIGLLMAGSGVQMRHSVTMKEIRADGFMLPLARVPTARAVSFAFTVLEYTPENLELVFPDSTLTTTAAAANQKGYKDLVIGSGQDNPEYAIGVEAFRKDSAGTKQPVRWRLYGASIEQDGESPFNQDNESMLPIVCHALHWDAAGKCAQLVYVTHPSTSGVGA